MTVPTVQRVYTRTDPRGRFPHPRGRGDLAINRLALFWRPLIDLADSAYAPVRLRAIPVVSGWLTDAATAAAPARRSWFSMIGVPGQRRQVLRHAGLGPYDAPAPSALPPALRTPRWQLLVDLIDHYRDLDATVRALVVFHLAQLSYCALAADLAEDARPAGDPDTDHYAYETARVLARLPGRIPHALALFEELAHRRDDERLVLAACFQGIGHGLRQGRAAAASGDSSADAFHRRARPAAQAPAADWHDHLLRSRFFRAAALLHLVRGDHAAVRADTAAALGHHDALGEGRDEAERLVVRENHRYLTELRLRAAHTLPGGHRELPALGERLARVDPNCVEVRLALGDCHAALADWTTAARWYECAGELGTGAGAIGWFRAAQCHDQAGDPGAALNAMAHCLELDTTAVEPRGALTNRPA